MFYAPFHVVLWRFLTGAHLDGGKPNNATWTSRATFPRHRISWWNSKPRLVRMLYRWLLLLSPVGWFLAYANSPVWHFNLVLGLSIALFPYLFHSACHNLRKAIGTPTVIHLFDEGPHDPEVVDHHEMPKGEVITDAHELTDQYLPHELTQPHRNGRGK